LEVEELRGKPVRHANTTEQLWAFARAIQTSNESAKEEGEEEEDLDQVSVLVTASVAIDLWELFGVLTAKAHQLAVQEANERHNKALKEQQELQEQEETASRLANDERRRRIEEEKIRIVREENSNNNNNSGSGLLLKSHVEDNEQVRMSGQTQDNRTSRRRQSRRKSSRSSSVKSNQGLSKQSSYSSSSSSGSGSGSSSGSSSGSESEEEDGLNNKSLSQPSSRNDGNKDWEKWARAEEEQLMEVSQVPEPELVEPAAKGKVWRRRGV
jgi:hypothetical protein